MSASTTHGLFLDNASVPIGTRGAIDVLDPADGSLVGSVTRATRADAGAAMDSAARAQPGWEAVGASARAKILLRAAERLRARREELARLVTREMG